MIYANENTTLMDTSIVLNDNDDNDNDVIANIREVILLPDLSIPPIQLLAPCGVRCFSNIPEENNNRRNRKEETDRT